MIKLKHQNVNERQWRPLGPPQARFTGAPDQHLEQPRRSQADLIAQWRSESYLDHAVPLAVKGVPLARPEFGPTAAEYYRNKHARGERGQFDPLWKLAIWHGNAVDRGIRLGTLNRRA